MIKPMMEHFRVVLPKIVILAMSAFAVMARSVAAAEEAKPEPLWSLKPFRAHFPPRLQDTGWPASRMDYFILGRVEAGGLKPNPDAEPAALLRRLYFDLIGLPPSVE